MCRTSPASLFYMVGITSWGKGCGEANSPGIYTSIRHFLEWILGEMIEIDGGAAPEKKQPPKHRTKDPVTLLPLKTATSQLPEDLLEVNFTDSSPELSTKHSNGDDHQWDGTTLKTRLEETEPAIALQAPFVPPGISPPSMEPPFIPLEQPVTLEPPFYPQDSPPTALAPPFIPKEIPPPSLKVPFIPPETRASLEPPYVAEEEPYVTPEPPILPTEPEYISRTPADKTTAYSFLLVQPSFKRALGPPPILPEDPPHVPSRKFHSTEDPYIPLDLPYTPPPLPYIPPVPVVPLERPYVPPEKPRPIERPFTPRQPRYIPPEPPFVPSETPAFLEHPYTPPEKPYPIERPFTPLQPQYTPPQPPYIPEEAPALLEEPYIPPERSPYRRHRQASPRALMTPAGFPYDPPKTAASLEHLFAPPEEVRFLQPLYIRRRKTHSLEPPKVPPMDDPQQRLAEPSAGQRMQELPVGLEPPYLIPGTLGSREWRAAPPGKL